VPKWAEIAAASREGDGSAAITCISRMNAMNVQAKLVASTSSSMNGPYAQSLADTAGSSCRPGFSRV